MKKILKVIGIILGSIVALALLLVLTLPIWLGPVVKPVASAAVPNFTKTSFNLGHLSLNPYTGRFELGDMVLGNPAGYDEPTAVAVSNIVVDVAMTTICDKYVHIEEVMVDGVFVSLVKGGENNVDNMLQIQYNVAGGKDKYEAKKAEAKKSEPAESAKAEEPEGDGKKIVIDVLTLKDIRVKYGMITIPVPSITLKDLGKESDGLTAVELFEKIWEAIIKAAMAVGDGVKVLGGMLKEGAGTLGDGAGKVLDAVGADKAVDAVGSGASKAVDAVGSGASKAADAIKGLFK